jgi:hypothetical protein
MATENVRSIGSCPVPAWIEDGIGSTSIFCSTCAQAGNSNKKAAAQTSKNCIDFLLVFVTQQDRTAGRLRKDS